MKYPLRVPVEPRIVLRFDAESVEKDYSILAGEMHCFLLSWKELLPIEKLTTTIGQPLVLLSFSKRELLSELLRAFP